MTEYALPPHAGAPVPPPSEFLCPSDVYKVLRGFALSACSSVAAQSEGSGGEADSSPLGAPGAPAALETPGEAEARDSAGGTRRATANPSSSASDPPGADSLDRLEVALARIDETLLPRIKEETVRLRERNASLRANYAAQAVRWARNDGLGDLGNAYYFAAHAECEVCSHSVLGAAYAAFPCGHVIHQNCLRRLFARKEGGLASPAGAGGFSGNSRQRPSGRASGGAVAASGSPVPRLALKPGAPSPPSPQGGALAAGHSPAGSMLDHCPFCTGDITPIPAPSRGELRLPTR